MPADRRSSPGAMMVHQIGLRTLDDRVLRGHPDLQAVPIAQLPRDQQDALTAVSVGVKLYGVLRRNGTGDEIVAIDHETAALFHALATPGAPPSAVLRILGSDKDRILARLVLDGVLQIQGGNGTFVDGLPACSELFPDPPDPEKQVNHPIAHLSFAAIKYGAAIRSFKDVPLGRRVYAYPSVPRSPAWDRLLPTRQATHRWIGLSSRAPWRRRLHRTYSRRRVRSENSPWVYWELRQRPEPDLRHKIYVSPIPEQLPDLFARVADLCCDMAVPAFKVGSDVANILRPDKLVLYVPSEQSMRRVASELGRALTGFRAHGVSFSAPLDGSGLLSWGVDPHARATTGLAGGGSWRAFVVNLVATALQSAASTEDEEAVIDFVLHRLRLEGIEPGAWRLPEGW